MRPGRLALTFSIGLGLTIALAASAAFAEPAAPKPPEKTIDPSEPAMNGHVIAVHASDNLQSALDRAEYGDTLALDAGASFEGSFTLPRKSGSGWITIRSSGAIPPAGTRVTPENAGAMAKLLAMRTPAIIAAMGAHNFRFVGIEIRPRANQFVNTLVQLGENAMLTEDLPHDIVFARCYIHGDPAMGGRRGIALNGGAAAVVDSWLSDFKEVGADSQALVSWSGTGPFLIANDYLEGAGENVMFGGADPPGVDRIPSDIVIRNNQFEKPLSWKAGAPGYAGTSWAVKNLLELKDARRVVIEDNLLEHNWAQGQNGFAVLFTVRNQEGTAPWSIVEDVTFARNVVRGAGSGINILGHDDRPGVQSEQAQRIDIRDNRFEDLGADWGGSGTLFQILQGAADVSIEHNTGLQSGSIIVAEGPPNLGFAFRNNIVMHNAYGITGTGAGTGTVALNTYFPGAQIEGNVFIGGEAARYPKGNLFAASVDAVFADAKHLHPRAPYANAGAPSPQ